MTPPPSNVDLQAALKDLSAAQMQTLIDQMTQSELEYLACYWPFWARKDQREPSYDVVPWRTWLFLGGRGAGKTRAGAEWVRQLATGSSGLGQAVSPIALIGEALHDVRAVMIEGESGILACHPNQERPKWEPSLRKLTWPNGAVAQVFSSEDPDALRGPQFAAAWGDEICKWSHATHVWDMLQFGLRLGQHPRALVTTTPKPTSLIKQILSDPKTVVRKAKTTDNANNLAPSFLDHIQQSYAGTALGRQELDGELIEEVTGALWTHAQLDQSRVRLAPDFKRLIISVDPAVTSHSKSDSTGIMVAGLAENDECYLIEDATQIQSQPMEWAKKIAALYARYEADMIICESNQGGELIQTLLHQIDRNLPVKNVTASKAKRARSEPVAALYARGLVHHVGHFAELENEMTSFTLQGLPNGKSPDRLDALVWAITELAMRKSAPPQVRSL